MRLLCGEQGQGCAKEVHLVLPVLEPVVALVWRFMIFLLLDGVVRDVPFGGAKRCPAVHMERRGIDTTLTKGYDSLDLDCGLPATGKLNSHGANPGGGRGFSRLWAESSAAVHAFSLRFGMRLL